MITIFCTACRTRTDTTNQEQNSKKESTQVLAGEEISFDGFSIKTYGYKFKKQEHENNLTTANYVKIDETDKYDIGERMTITHTATPWTDDDWAFINQIAEDKSLTETEYGDIKGFQYYAVGMYHFMFDINGIGYEISCTNKDDFDKIMESFSAKQ
jgi:hypothetical protein